MYPIFEESTNAAVRGWLPEILVTLLELSTHLGDRGVIIAVVVMAFWFGSERREVRGWMIAILVAGIALQIGLKGVIGVERPEGLAFAPEQDGYALPSGHALGAAAAYGALAAGTRLWTARTRYTLAAAVIVLVALSRVVLGVHFLDDVLLGGLLGVALVVGGAEYVDRRPTPVFAFAGVVAIGSVLLGSTYQLPHGIGFPLGAAVAWYLVRDRPWSTGVRPIAAAGIPVAAVLVALEMTVMAPARHVAIELVASALGIGLLVALPAVAHVVDRGRLSTDRRPVGYALGTFWIAVAAAAGAGTVVAGLDPAFYRPIALGSLALGGSILGLTATDGDRVLPADPLER